MEKVYLVLKRHIVKQTKRKCIWSEWYTFSLDACFDSVDDAFDLVLSLREQAEHQGFDFVDYRVQVLFVHHICSSI